MFNKNKCKKISDKKILHKVRSHWSIISIALLSMIGGVAATHTNVNADANSQGDNNQVNHQVNSVSLTQNKPQLVDNQANHSGLYNESTDKTTRIANQSTNLHNQIIERRTGLHKFQGSSVRRPRLLDASNVSKSTSSSTKISQPTSLSASQSASASSSVANSITESILASNAAASVVAHGGHVISVSPSVRSLMINGASEIASYNQITKSNADATADYLNRLDATTPSLSSEKASAEVYAQRFYNNKQIENEITVNSEAAHDIKVWGEDPDYFTIYQTKPANIVNNVRSFYEPNASAVASATGLVEARVKSICASTSASASQSASQGPKSFASTLSNDASTLNSYNQKNQSYVSTILFDLGSLNVSDNPILNYAKANAPKYFGRVTSFMNKESNEVKRLDNQSDDSNSANNASTISTANKDISEASLVANKASSVMAKYIEPLEQSLEAANATQPSSTPSVNSSSDNNSASVSQSASESLSNSIQNSILVSQYNSSVNASNAIRTSLMTSASISNSIASSVAAREAQMSGSLNTTSQSNPQVSLSPSQQRISDNSQSSTASNSGDNLVHFWDDPSSSSSDSVSNSAISASTGQSEFTNESSNSSSNQEVSNNSNRSDVNDDPESAEPKSGANDNQPLSPSVNNSQRGTEGVNSINNDGQGEQAGVTHDSTPLVNNDPVSATDIDNNQTGSNDKLPQTNESSAKSREMAEISLIMSTTLGALGMYIDRRRHDND